MNNNQSNCSNSDRVSEPSSSSIGIDLDEGENYFYIDDKGEKVPVNIDELRDLESGEEFLLYYARHGEALMVNRLCNTKKIGQLELNINCKGKKKCNHGWTPLHLASYFGHYEVVKILLENGAQVNVINDDGDTPLHKAAYVGRLDIVVLLLAHQANVFTKNAKGKTPQDLSQSTEIIDALLAAEATDMRRKEDRFLRAARDGELDVVKELLNDINPVEINCKDSSGNNALHWAAYRNHKEIVVYLLQNGIDSTVKNNQDQTPALMATNVQTKQLISDVQPIAFNVNMKSLAKCMINRFEGPLLRRSRLLVRKCLWIVLERGVLSFYSNRADASSGIKRKGYKFLECAHVEASSKDETSFIIYFNDNSRCTLSTIPSNKISSASILQLDRQKWMNAIKDHIDYATKFFRSGLRVDFENAGALGQSSNGKDSPSSKDEEDVLDFLSAPSLQPYINNAQAHVTILQKHIKAMMQLVEESSQILRADTLELSGTDAVEYQRFKRDLTMEWKNFWPSVKFHFNIILKAGDHTSAALSDCLTILSQQDQLRQLLSQRDQEKIRVLEQSLKVLTREHRRSSLLNSSSSMSPQRLSCKGHLSDTDLDEYYDALEDSDDDFNDSVSQKTLESLGKTLTNGDHLAKNSSSSSERKDSLTETSLFKSTKDLFSMLPN